MFEPQWVIPGVLARSARPGRALGPYEEAPKEEVDSWLAVLRGMGILSIICLLDDKHLCLYKDLPEGLVEYYRACGFHAAHIMVRDPVLGGIVQMMPCRRSGWLIRSCQNRYSYTAVPVGTVPVKL